MKGYITRYSYDRPVQQYDTYHGLWGDAVVARPPRQYVEVTLTLLVHVDDMRTLDLCRPTMMQLVPADNKRELAHQLLRELNIQGGEK
jgi:hypothetical protein